IARRDVLLDHRPPWIAGLEASLVKPNLQSGAAEAALQPLDGVMILAGITDENGGGPGRPHGRGSAPTPVSGPFGEGVPFFRKLVHELDGIRYTKRPRLRTEVLQEIVEDDVTRYGSVSHEFARIITAVEAITAGKANKEPRQPIGMSITDKEQSLRAHFVEEICKARRVRLFMKFPDEFERFFVNERAVIREPGNPAKKMKNHAVRRARIIA